MVEEKLSVLDKFKLLKDVGFHGVELDSPNDLNMKEILEARDKTGLLIPGTVNSLHWKSPISDPDPKVRATCTESMKSALRDTKAYGGNTVLLVNGVVNEKVSYDEAWTRSLEEIRKMIPVAEETGVKIAIENVWNNFLISPMEAARYVDEINNPMVGWYFDIGNILRYGWPEQWIKILGKRILKLDMKEYSRKKMNEEGLWKGFDIEIGDGDNNWPVVMEALRAINYSGGWISAEVSGGDRKRLQEISERMDKVLK
jgi:hexulose-6-phosphate isomerase